MGNIVIGKWSIPATEYLDFIHRHREAADMKPSVVMQMMLEEKKKELEDVIDVAVTFTTRTKRRL